MRRLATAKLLSLLWTLSHPILSARAVEYIGRDGEVNKCVCFDTRTLVAFGGGSVKGCKRSYGRIAATSSKAEGGVGIQGEWMCGQEPYPSYSHLCMDTCNDQSETAHVEDANKIDPSGDWADASRFPEKYAAWRQQMPQRADDDGFMQPGISVTYPEARPSTTSRSSATLTPTSLARIESVAHTSQSPKQLSQKPEVATEPIASTGPSNPASQRMSTTSTKSRTSERLSQSPTTTDHPRQESRVRTNSSTTSSSASPERSTTSSASTSATQHRVDMITSSSTPSSNMSTASIEQTDMISNITDISGLANTSDRMGVGSSPATASDSSPPQVTSHLNKPVGTSTIEQPASVISGVSVTATTYSGLEEGFAVVTGVSLMDLYANGLLIGTASKMAPFSWLFRCVIIGAVMLIWIW